MADSRFSVDDILKEVEQMRRELTASKEKSNSTAGASRENPVEPKKPEIKVETEKPVEKKPEIEVETEAEAKPEPKAEEPYFVPSKVMEQQEKDEFEQLLQNALKRADSSPKATVKVSESEPVEEQSASKSDDGSKYHPLRVADREEIENSIKRATGNDISSSTPDGKKTEKITDFFSHTSDSGYTPGQNEKAREKAQELYNKHEASDKSGDTIVSPLKNSDFNAKSMLTPEEINGNTIVVPVINNPNVSERPDNEEEIDDYYSIKDADDIRREFKGRLFGVSGRLIVTLLCTLFGAALTVLPQFGVSFSLTSSVGLVYTELALLAVVVIANISTLLRGFLWIFALKAQIDSPVAVAVVVSAIQLGYLCVFPDKAQSALIYAPVAMFAVLCSLIGKRILISRIIKNFQLVTTPDSKQSSIILPDDTAQKIAPDEIGERVVCCQKSVINLQKYMHNSLCEDPADTVSRVMSPLAIVIAVLAGVVAWMFTGDWATVFSSAAVFAVATVPVANLISTNLPLTSLCSRLRLEGGLVTGYQSADEISKVNTVILSDEDLFPEGTVDIVSVKPVKDIKVSEVMVRAAALMLSTPNALADAFDRMIDGHRNELPNVENTVCYDGEGVSGVVDGNIVKFGNRKLMQNDGVSDLDLPDDEFEQKILRNGNFPYYISVNGVFSAVCIMNYRSDIDEMGDIRRMVEQGVDLYVRTVDPYLTAETIETLFDLPENSVSVLNSTQRAAYDAAVIPEQNGEAVIANAHDAAVFAATVNGCKRVRSRIMCGVFIQVVLCVLAFVGLVYYTYAGSNLTAAPYILLFQAFSALAVSFIPMLYSLK